jgi:hypothetical protein
MIWADVCFDQFSSISKLAGVMTETGTTQPGLRRVLVGVEVDPLRPYGTPPPNPTHPSRILGEAGWGSKSRARRRIIRDSILRAFLICEITQ